MVMKQQLNDSNYFDHDADVGIIGYGPDIESAFVNAAEATFSLMSDLSKVNKKESFSIEFNETDQAIALVTWLNLLIAKAQIAGLALCDFQLTKNNSHWQGQAWGEPWHDKLERGVEVKGATLTMLSVEQLANGDWQACCVVDV